jgi:NADH-quinone oxidoreductase subunit N
MAEAGLGDQMALLPGYVAAGTAVLVLLADLLVPGRRGAVLLAAVLGCLGTLAATIWVAAADRTYSAFCVGPGASGGACSIVTDDTAAVIGGAFALLTLGVVALSTGLLRTGEVPPGEYCFLLACSMTGGVVLGSTRDLISLIVALETLTLPLYVLVGLRRRRAGAEAAVTFFVVSVVSTTVALLGAALLYAATGAVHFTRLAAALGAPLDPHLRPLLTVGAVLLLAGLAFKVAAVPLHAWAASTYDGAPLPVAAYLSTASKLGGVGALVLVTLGGLGPVLGTAGPALAVLAVLTMTVGNVVALRQRRMVRLLAWSSIAQAGYILAPLGAFALRGGRTATAVPVVVAAVVAYTIFYLLLEFGAFAAVVGLRGTGGGGTLDEYRGAARRSPGLTAALVLSLAGLAGLPPGLAGLFAKVAVVRALLGGGAAWLAIVVAVNAVVGLAYYIRVAAGLFGGFAPGGASSGARSAGAPLPGVPLPGAPFPGAPLRGTPFPGGSPVAEAGAGSVAEPGAEPGAVPGAGPGAVPGAGPGAVPGAEAGSGPGAEPGAEPGAVAVPWAVGAAVAVATGAALVVGFAPQLIMSLAGAVHP